MVTRLLSANASEILKMNGAELKQSILASEGRTIVSENVTGNPVGDGLTASEYAAAFGADLILLNGLDVFNPAIFGLYPSKTLVPEPQHDGESVHRLQQLVGRPIGVNLEPVDVNADMQETREEIPAGRQASEATFKEAERLGFNFVCLTGNPGTGVTNAQIAENIKVAKRVFSGLIIAGKMHAAGVNEPVIDQEAAEAFLAAGADVILVPAVGTVPGLDESDLKPIVKLVHAQGALVMSAIGTSQESSGAAYIAEVAVRNKVLGMDIQHIGDAGWGVQSPFENIYALSKAIRGERHALQRMARSINR